MARIHAEASAVINAPPEEVYGIIADYRNGHPHILPEENFKDLKVVEGGRGEGTIITFRTITGRVDRAYRMVVSEPEPGRVLKESDTSSSVVTTFTVTPADGGSRSRVQIITEWDSAGGLRGLAERTFAPRMLQPVYEKELKKLAEFVKKPQSGSETASL
jgi:hypothetical protein